jgi:hypothetical protein
MRVRGTGSLYHRAVLTEEALLLIVTLVGCVLIALGTLELVAPTRPRHPRRPPERGLSRRVEDARLVAVSTPSVQLDRVIPPAEVIAVMDAPLAPSRTPVASRTPLASSTPVVARCEQLLDDERYDDVVRTATAALGPEAEALAPADAASLWSLVGRARHAEGDEEGARVALESAVALAPDATRAEHERWLAVLALAVARDRLDVAVGDGPLAPEERVEGIRSALTWLHRGLSVRARDVVLGELAAAARVALWPAYEEAVRSLAERHEYHRARRLVGQALGENDVPPERQQALRDLLSGTFSSEIGHLSAHAIRSLHESREAEALSALERAEELIAAMPEDALSSERREEVERRLLSGYTRVGRRRVESGQFEEALVPLLRAVRVPAAGSEARAALVRALDGVVDTRTADIRRLADRGEREQALAAREELWAQLVSARAAGLSRDDLQAAVTKARRLFAALDVEA